VRCRTRSAFPIGATLSGGLDSSSIACTAKLLLAAEDRLPLHTFSAEWPSMISVDPKVDERRFIDAVTSTGGLESHFVRADEHTPLTFLDRITWHLDGVLAAPNIYATWSLLEAARRHDVRALFHGTDGDTTVSYGYEDLPEFARRGWGRTLVREARALSTNMPSRQHSLSSLLWRQTFKPLALDLVPEWAKDFRSVVRRKPRVDGRRTRVYERCDSRPFNPDFARRVNIRERYWDLCNTATPPKASAREYHWRAVTCGMFSHLLEAFEKSGGPFSVEFRYPFFVRRLVEFCLALPPGQRLNQGWTRSILRRAMTGILPPEVQWRTGKGNLSANVRLLMKREKSALDEVFLGESDVLREYVDLPTLRALYGRVRHEPLLSHDDSYFMLLVVNLHRWLQTAQQSPGSS
jgi:asparagine synthase (glutamine-hydrolysing)